MITSTKNQRIVDVRKLTQRKHRLRQNRFLVEGLQLLGLAVEAARRPEMRAKIIPHEIFYSEALFSGDSAPRLLTDLSALGGEAIPVAPHVLDTLSDRDTSQGLLATFALAELETTLESITNYQLPITNYLPSSSSSTNCRTPATWARCCAPPMRPGCEP